MVLLAAVPMLLVIKQPDLGTAILMAVVLMVMLAMAGMPGRYLILLIVGALIVTVVCVEARAAAAVPDPAADRLHLAQRSRAGPSTTT